MEQQEEYAGTELEQAPPSLMQKTMERLQQREEFLRTHRSVTDLIEGIEHPRWEIRAAAVWALAEHEVEEARNTLSKAMNDAHPQVRMAALRALSRQPDAMDAVITGLHDPAWEVQEMARILLQEQAQVRYQPVKKRQSVLRERFLHIWNIFVSQPRIMHPGTWLASAIVFGIFTILACLHVLQISFWEGQEATRWFTTMIVGASAISAAFIYGQEADPALELIQTTPGSQRLILGSRIVLLFGYNSVLASLLSALFILLYGGSFWQIVQLWLGPLLLLSAASMALLLFVSSVVAVGIMLVVEAFQFLEVTSRPGLPILQPLLAQLWQTNPQSLLAALGLLILVLWYMPERKRYVPTLL